CARNNRRNPLDEARPHYGAYWSGRLQGVPRLKTVAEFEIQYHQFLDAGGGAVGPLPEFAKDPAELLKMYRLMTLVRAFDTKCINLQRTGKLGTYASCLGHEATHVGVGAAMRPDDVPG